MGNSGSAHNLHNGGVNSEINAYYTQQQYLKRTAGEAKKYNTNLQNSNNIVVSGMERSSTDRLRAAFKVLPKPRESIKLRATTNGALLHAGGTISFRAKDSLDDKSGSSGLDREEDPTFHPMRRSHTLILNSHNESSSYRKSAPPLTEFRRSHSLLHVDYNRANSQENRCSPKFDERKNGLTLHTTANGTGSILKINKYYKKRKAPPAPIINPTMDGGCNISSGSNLAAEAKTTCLAKPRIYATNSNKPINSLQQQPHPPRLQKTSSFSPFAPFQRGSHTRNSANSQVNGRSKTSKVPYRREKSFDAVLLRQRDSNNEYYERSQVQMRKPFSERERDWEHHSKIVKHTNYGNRGSQLLRKPSAKNTLNKISSTTKDFNGTAPSTKISQNEEAKLREKILQKNECLTPHDLYARNAKEFNDKIQTVENNAGTEKTVKVQQQSRIPQLKRTFYFGMESTTSKNPTADEHSKNNGPMNIPLRGFRREGEKKEAGRGVDESGDMNTHNLAKMEEIEDNGILVHVRPTLPRRQPETPSFSPAAAWRNLLEEQQRLQHERAKAKQAMLNDSYVETPICLNSDRAKESLTKPLTWTPQQDLEDEDEEENDEKIKQNDLKLPSSKLESKKPEKRSTVNSLHIFSLSLPRHVHLPGQFKNSLDCSETSRPGLKTNYWMVPGFNSLQKFKTTLSGGVGKHLNSKCTCSKDLSKRVSVNNSQAPPQFFQSIFGDTFTTDPHNHGLECELSKSFQCTPSSYNDNWVLHKSKINKNSVPTTTTNTSPHFPANGHSLVYIQPKSLTHVCGGKHVMYLPGQETFDASNKESQQKTVTSKRQRPEMARETLQDLTPVQDIEKSNVRMPEKNTQRFSFQSTVRVLEKRRLAEKLSKDAEIQEAQRLHELEAMKRVEEDFQRKRAQEKANIRNQLRIHLNSNSDNENFRSLPLHINENHDHHLQQSDTNNNIFCRAEPDGAVSPSPVFNDSHHKSLHYNFPLIFPKTIDMRRSDLDCEESELELTKFQQTALLIEPYLQSIS